METIPQEKNLLNKPRKSVLLLESPPLAVYNQNFKARFAHLCRKLEELSRANLMLSSNGSPIKSVDDVDFVFIAEKTSSPSLSFRCANWLAKKRGREPITDETIAKARLEYLATLKDKFKVEYSIVETPDRYYYLIQLSFHHLGLMLELLGYQWQLRSADPTRKAFKTFFFLKRKVQRYQEYYLSNGETRASFPARWRYDLAYYFLMGAVVAMPYVNVWRNALKEPLAEQIKNIKRRDQNETVENTETEDATTKHERGYALMRLFADGLFDDWMVLHSKARKPTTEETIERLKTAAHSKNCCTAGCVRCFFPAITCQCGDVEAGNLTNEFHHRKACPTFGVALCNIWRSFWYNNLVDSADMPVRTLSPEGRPENTREYLGRIGTARNAIHFDTYKPPLAEKCAKMRHFLPLDKLNDYFGEKIGFYFGWIELLVLSLIIPAIVGIAMFVCGVAYYTWAYVNNSEDDDMPPVDDYIGYILAKACDNYATPGFAALMVIWGTTFYELWNRRQKWYAFMWRVESLEQTELERPPVYSLKFAAYLRKSRFGTPLMYIPSALFTLFFIGLVFASVYFINVMNIFSITYCPKPRSMLNNNSTTPSPSLDNSMQTLSPLGNLIVDSVVCNAFAAAQVLANSMSMFILDSIFTRLCYWLTDVEGHLTQSEYTDALIFKLFTFRFFNYYSVLFYIAFGIPTKLVQYPKEITGGTHYDYEGFGCGQQPCMALLSRQLLSIIVTQPFLNSIIDISLPILKLIYLSVKESSQQAQRKLSRNKVDAIDMDQTKPEPSSNDELKEELNAQYRLMELSTLDRREFTAEEYTDKLIVFGALVMFSVALPPAPALAFLIMRIDLNLDLGRIMTRFRRPLPHRAQDIGMWGNIVNFLTYLGIITNPLIVVLTSSWGTRFNIWWKFVIFLVVEHVVFAVRMLVTFIVPDVPKSLTNQQQMHKMVKDEVQGALTREKTAFIQSQSRG